MLARKLEISQFGVDRDVLLPIFYDTRIRVKLENLERLPRYIPLRWKS